MKFGFNKTTDEAIEAMDRLNIRYKREETGISVYTNTYDLITDDLRERSLPTNIKDLNDMYKAQGVRLWKSPETGRYYYLIHDTVFYMEKKIVEDNSTDPPTKFETSIFDIVDPYDQDHFRDILIQLPQAVNRPLI